MYGDESAWRDSGGKAFEVGDKGMAGCLDSPRAVKQVSGRKTTMKDAEPVAQLLECGIVKAISIPPRENIKKSWGLGV